ncbi:MAG: 3-isopropylmalate dehydratase [Pseudomonadota bacterium]
MKNSKIWKYGDDVNTDVIFAGKYTYTVTEESEMAKYALEDLDPEFAGNVKNGDIIIAGKNFGCGSSREQAVKCLKLSGVSFIIAKSFARIYYRNCINEGLPAISCPELVDNFNENENIEINIKEGIIKTENGKEYKFAAFPDSVLKIIEAGGLVNYLKA